MIKNGKQRFSRQSLKYPSEKGSRKEGKKEGHRAGVQLSTLLAFLLTVSARFNALSAFLCFKRFTSVYF